MRRLVIALAIGLGLYSFFKGRRIAAATKKNWKRTTRKRAVENGARQKPGQVKVPKIPKVKRSKD